jgi:hypothetical protein
MQYPDPVPDVPAHRLTTLVAPFTLLRLVTLAALWTLAGCAEGPKQSGPACTETADCPAGAECTGGTCRPRTCGGRTTCPEGSVCAVGDDGAGVCVAAEPVAACADGETRPCRSACGDGTQTCTDGQFGACSAVQPAREICGDGQDQDCDGQTDEGCDSCLTEICGDGLDQDCDGVADEGCAGGCAEGEKRPCETLCGDGEQVCDGERWGPCSAPMPQEEGCNNVDDDCDGATDEDVFRACQNACGDGMQQCFDGEWGACSAPEDCACADGTVDERGCPMCQFQTRTCEGEAFGEWGACQPDPAAVCQGDQAEEQPCGRCGTQRRTCRDDCSWTDWLPCEAEGPCEAGAFETEACENGCGVRTRRCADDCEWGEWSECRSEQTGAVPECQPDEVETRACGNCGQQTRTCGETCGWGEWTACGDEGDCAPGDERAEACEEACSARVSVCSEACEWGDFGECSAGGQCTPGEMETEACGRCGTRARSCDDACVFSEWSECAGEGVCDPGDFRSEPCGVSQAGACQFGERTQDCDGETCQWTMWSECEGNIDPVEERCGGPLDTNCDGALTRSADVYEPNDTCAMCRLVSDEQDPVVTLDATHDSPGDVWDYYCFNVDDGFSIIGSRERITVELSNIAEGADLDLYLYASLADCEAGNSLALSIAGGNADEAIEWVEPLNNDNSGTVVVGVRAWGDRSCDVEYQLSFDGLR